MKDIHCTAQNAKLFDDLLLNIFLMFEGNILKAGTPEVLAQDEMVRKVYLGQNFELRKKKLIF